MAASSRISTFSAILRLDKRGGTMMMTSHHCQCLRVRAAAHQDFRDEGKKSRKEIDDATMRVLMERMEVIRAKESLERLFVDHQQQQQKLVEAAGWTNVAGYQHRKKPMQSHFLELVMMICGTFGFTIASGTLCLCLASILVHLNQ